MRHDTRAAAEDAISCFQTHRAAYFTPALATFAGLPGEGWYVVDLAGRPTH